MKRAQNLYLYSYISCPSPISPDSGNRKSNMPTGVRWELVAQKSIRLQRVREGLTVLVRSGFRRSTHTHTNAHTTILCTSNLTRIQFHPFIITLIFFAVLLEFHFRYLLFAISTHHLEGYRGEGDRAPIDAAFFMGTQGVRSYICKDIITLNITSIPFLKSPRIVSLYSQKKFFNFVPFILE